MLPKDGDRAGWRDRAPLGALLLLSPWGVLAQTLSPNVIRQIAAISAEKELRTPQQMSGASNFSFTNLAISASSAFRG